MKTESLWMIALLAASVLLASCSSAARVGPLLSESTSVDLGGAKSVRVKVDFGAGNLDLSGGAANLLDADFSYNVARLKPDVKYSDGNLVVRQPSETGLPALQGITDFRNDWNLRLYRNVPMDLSVTVGGGFSNLQLARLALTRLNISLGAGQSTIDLNANWADNLDVTIDAGATDLTVRLPTDVGVRVEVDRGPTLIDAPGLTKDGSVYTNDAYGVSKVTLHIVVKSGIGLINLELPNSE